MINNIYTFYKYDTTTFNYVGKSKSSTNKTGIDGFTIDKPINTTRGNIAVYTDGVGPWVEAVDPTYSIVQERTLATTRINTNAEIRRAQQITPNAIQSLVYLEKYAQASAYKDAGYPVDTSPYPFIGGDVIALSKTATAAADDIIVEYDATLAYNVLVEQYRLQTQVAIAAAVNSSEIETAMSDFNNLLDAI